MIKVIKNNKIKNNKIKNNKITTIKMREILRNENYDKSYEK